MVENSYEKKSRLIRDNGATRQKTKRGGGQNFEIYRRSTLSTTRFHPVQNMLDSGFFVTSSVSSSELHSFPTYESTRCSRDSKSYYMGGGA